MDLTTTALPYLLKAFSENAEAKQFKDDFFGAFVSWVRPLFLKDDPAAAAVLEMKDAETAKETVIAAKLPALLNQPEIKEKLTEFITQLRATETRERGILKDATLEMDGDIHVGDRNLPPGSDDHLDRKNVVENVNIKGRNLRIGDDYR